MSLFRDFLIDIIDHGDPESGYGDSMIYNGDSMINAPGLKATSRMLEIMTLKFWPFLSFFGPGAQRIDPRVSE